MTYGNRSFSWNTGRNLAQITDSGNTYSYKYDENGIRTSKTVNGVTTYYNTKDGVILSQSDGTNTMYFQYDTNGTPFGFVYNGTQYFYLTNPMGDVIGIVDFRGNIVCEYVYDEWGKVLDVYVEHKDNAEYVSAANANPIRYRGYYYDAETSYYYLQSRYYDPSICRFINADIPEIAQMSKNIPVGTNLFAYCSNDPINKVDIFGFISTSVAKISKNEIKIIFKLTDSDIRKIVYGISVYIIIYDAAIAIAGKLLIIPTYGAPAVAATIVGVLKSAFASLIIAYINYNNYGKGAKIEVYMKYGIKTFCSPVWRYTRWGSRILYLKKYKVPYYYFSRIPKITWYK